MNPRDFEEDDDDVENLQLEDFYCINRSSLMEMRLSSVPSHVFRKISDSLSAYIGTGYHWRDFASSIGIDDYSTVAEIERNANNNRESTLYVTLDVALQRNKSFWVVIKALLNKKQLHLLTELKDDVIELLEKHSSTKVKRVISMKEESCNMEEQSCSTEEQSTEEFSNCISETVCDVTVSDTSDNSKKSDASTVYYKSNGESTPCMINSFNRNLKERDCVTEQIQQSSIGKELKLNPVTILPSAPSDDLTVLIQHTESENSIAEHLSNMFTEEGITVKILSDIDHLLSMDSMGALAAIFQQVDFVVPVVSEELLEQVHPQETAKYLETDARSNRCLYQLIVNEYVFNRCVNFRVRSVLVPEMNRKLLKNDVIFSSALRLWGEVPKLVNILRKTKELIPQYPFH